jgi:4-amino-4-deoxy-L-arabinose transferase-like glycosyltransferase
MEGNRYRRQLPSARRRNFVVQDAAGMVPLSRLSGSSGSTDLRMPDQVASAGGMLLQCHERWASSRTAGWFWLLLAIYLAVHLVLRLAMSQTLQHDESEQPIFAQSLSAGYSGQPPLYTWLVWLLARAWGMHLATLAILKTAILGCVYGFLFLAARRLVDEQRAALAVASLLLVPVFAWEFLRDYTHSPLACAVSAATLHSLLRLHDRGRLVDYLVLGLLIGLGMLAKYNYLLFAAALLLAGLTVPSFRSRILDRRLILAVMVAGLVFAPHGIWLVNHWDQVRGFIGGRAGLGHPSGYLPGVARGTGSLAWNLFLFLSPLWLILLVVIPQGFRLKGRTGLAEKEPCLIGRFLAAALLLLFLQVVVLRVTRFYVHWFEPILLLLPLWYFRRAGAMPARAVRQFAAVALLAGLAVVIGRSGEAWFGWQSGKYGGRDRLFAAQVRELKKAGHDRGILLTESQVIAGNLRLLLPELEVGCLKFPLTLPNHPVECCCIVWDATYDDSPSVLLTRCVREQLRLETVRVVCSGHVGSPEKTPHRHTNRLGYAVLAR